MTLTDRLRSEGYVVETAGDGEVGLSRASGESFDLIILDVMLPRRTASTSAATCASAATTPRSSC